jgi:hypothetical protein
MGFNNNKLNRLNHLIQGKKLHLEDLKLKKQTSLNKILQMSKNFKKNEKEKGSGRVHVNYANALKNVTNIDKNMEKIKKELNELRNDKRKLIERRKIEN